MGTWNTQPMPQCRRFPATNFRPASPSRQDCRTGPSRPIRIWPGQGKSTTKKHLGQVRPATDKPHPGLVGRNPGTNGRCRWLPEGPTGENALQGRPSFHGRVGGRGTAPARAGRTTQGRSYTVRLDQDSHHQPGPVVHSPWGIVSRCPARYRASAPRPNLSWAWLQHGPKWT